MHILLVEGYAGEARETEQTLQELGHSTYRCADHDAAAFPCNGMATGACPLEHEPIDAAVLVRTELADMPTAREDGARCALRRHVPLVLAGDVEASAYRDWATDTTQDLATIPEAVKLAASRQLDRHSEAAQRSFLAVLVGSDLSTEGADAAVRRSGTDLRVTLSSPEVIPQPLRESAAVRAAGAVRDVDPYVSRIDVEVAAPTEKDDTEAEAPAGLHGWVAG